MTPIIFIVTFALSGTFDLGQMDARFVECSFGRYRISCDDGQSNPLLSVP